MKTVITVSGRGVITLPAKLRQALGLKAGGQLIAETTPEGLLLRPAITLAVETYTEEREAQFDAEEAALGAFLRREPASESSRRRASTSRRNTRR